MKEEGEERQARAGLAMMGQWTHSKWTQFLEVLEGDLRRWWRGDEDIVESMSFLTAGQKKRLHELHRCGEAWVSEAVASWPGRVLLYDDGEFPHRLKEMREPPVALHLLGSVQVLNASGIAVVGSRKITVSSAQQGRRLLQPAVRRGMKVISGGAIGADAVAHRATLDAAGKAVAVLPSGVIHPSPRSNAGLFREILDSGGVLVSEYAPGEEVRKYHFRRRNTLIAALSQGVFVLRAGEKSGTMLTVEAAEELGRPLAAMPGAPQDRLSQGCHEILRRGGRMIASAEDLIRWWAELSPETRVEQKESEAVQQSLALVMPRCELLQAAVKIVDHEDAFSVEALARATGQPAAQVQARLLEHELTGWVERAGAGERYRLCQG